MDVNSDPHLKLYLNSITDSLTHILNLLVSKVAFLQNGSITNSDRFIYPSKQLPPLGNGSYAQGFTPA